MRNNWQKNGDTLGQYVIYTKRFAADETITLKGNSLNSSALYGLIFEPDDSICQAKSSMDNSLGFYSFLFEPGDTLNYLQDEKAQVIPQNNGIELCAYPAPFTSSVNIRLNLAVKGDVLVRFYDSQGRLVKVIALGKTSSGMHNIVWDGTGMNGMKVAAGVYYCQAKVDNRIVVTRLLTLLR